MGKLVLEADGTNIDLETFAARFAALHPDSQAAIMLLLRLAELHAVKAVDYGSDDDPFANYEFTSKASGAPGWVYPATRLLEKTFRVVNIARNRGKFSGAEAKESFGDLALISAICYAMVRREEKK